MDFNLAVMLAESARRTPGKPAVILGDTKLSYAAARRAVRPGRGLPRRAGLAPGDRVGLQLPNIPQFVIAYFGILKAGGVVVPMNVLLKAPEIEFQLRDSGARALITFAARLDEAAKAAEAAAVTVAVCRRRDRRHLAAGASFDDAAGRRSARAAAGRAQPGRPGGDHLHLGHDGQPRRARCCPTSRCT